MLQIVLIARKLEMQEVNNMDKEKEHLEYLQKRIKSKYGNRRIVYNLFNFPVTNFLNYFENDHIFTPEYQRGLVWEHEQKELLVESIMTNIPIGNIFINDRGYNHYEIVDGQQRLDAIWNFYNNNFTWEGLLFKELPMEMQSRFEMFVLATYITKYKERKQIIELYYRINWAGVEHSVEELIKIDKELRK